MEQATTPGKGHQQHAPHSLWDAIRLELADAETPLSTQDLVRRVAQSSYPGTPTRVRIRSVVRRQILFHRITEIEPGIYTLKR